MNPRKANKPRDGFYWERWRDGKMIESGTNNATEMPFTDATVEKTAWYLPVTMDAFQDIYKGRGTKGK